MCSTVSVLELLLILTKLLMLITNLEQMKINLPFQVGLLAVIVHALLLPSFLLGSSYLATIGDRSLSGGGICECFEGSFSWSGVTVSLQQSMTFFEMKAQNCRPPSNHHVVLKNCHLQYN